MKRPSDSAPAIRSGRRPFFAGRSLLSALLAAVTLLLVRHCCPDGLRADGGAGPAPSPANLSTNAPFWPGLSAPPARMAWIHPGRFQMGSPTEDKDRQPDEARHEVVITRGFWMGRYEVTQAEFEELTGANPSDFKGTNLPVERVTWVEATNYCARLTARERAAGRIPASCEFRLPTEAEWEYACRAGTDGATAFGKSLTSRQANFDGTYPYAGGAIGPNLEKTAPVGSYPPNVWGLFDMHGNVWEWCSDWYGEYGSGAASDPAGPASGVRRVNRGGSWGDVGLLCRSGYRGKGVPGSRVRNLGFRVVLARIGD